ncbi:hypothetical protein PM082_023092 [Marasmius tenuissimus]|nr:hypothetical protein PM082_023092 [Marasmius tenuissimus]
MHSGACGSRNSNTSRLGYKDWSGFSASHTTLKPRAELEESHSRDTCGNSGCIRDDRRPLINAVWNWLAQTIRSNYPFESSFRWPVQNAGSS